MRPWRWLVVLLAQMTMCERFVASWRYCILSDKRVLIKVMMIGVERVYCSVFGAVVAVL
jgi:hypothetical protein